MEIGSQKLAQMRDESQNTMNILEDVLSSNTTDGNKKIVESVIETNKRESPKVISLSPIKEKIGKFHLVFLKEIHELGKQNSMTNDSIEAIAKKYHINLFSALARLDEFATEKYQIKILKKSLLDSASKEIRIEFDSANVDKFLSMENADNWKTNLGCCRPDDSSFQQQITAYLQDQGFDLVSKNVPKTTSTVQESNDATIKVVLFPKTEPGCGITIEHCSAGQQRNEVTVIAQLTAKKHIAEYRKIHFIAYDKNDRIIGKDYEFWSQFGTFRSVVCNFDVDGKAAKVEVFPGM